MEAPSPYQSPILRPDLPTYPVHLQSLRITGSTVEGPPGGNTPHEAFTQQLDETTLLPRDREVCLAVDLNGVGLPPGYYLGRLAGSYAGLPIYEIAFCTGIF